MAEAPARGAPTERAASPAILYVIDSLKIGGAETLLLDLATGCMRRGYRAEIAYFTPGPLVDRFAALGIPTWRVSSHGLATPAPVYRLLHRMRRSSPTIVHTHLRKSDLAGQLAARLARIPVRICTVHNVDPWRRNALWSGIDRALTAGCQYRIAVSPAVHEHLQLHSGYAARTLTTIDNGVDTVKFDPRASHAARRPGWQLEPEHEVIGIVGRLETQKDHATFVRAAAIVAARNAAARFVIVGDGPLRNEIERACVATGYRDRFVFAGIENDMPAAFAAMDIVAFSSRWEGLPVALLEAMAMARPVVSTNAGGIADVVAQPDELVAPADAQALAGRLIDLLGDPTAARAQGAHNREIVCRGYSLDRSLQQTLSLYEQAIARALGRT